MGTHYKQITVRDLKRNYFVSYQKSGTLGTGISQKAEWKKFNIVFWLFGVLPNAASIRNLKFYMNKKIRKIISLKIIRYLWVYGELVIKHEKWKNKIGKVSWRDDIVSKVFP